MRESGVDIITYKNRENLEVYYPRGKAFFSRLSGLFFPSGDSLIVRTSDNCTTEIRRGDAICIGNPGEESWYRVNSDIGREIKRSEPPRSVTSVEEMSKKNEYIEEFTPRVNEVEYFSITICIIIIR